MEKRAHCMDYISSHNYSLALVCTGFEWIRSGVSSHVLCANFKNISTVSDHDPHSILHAVTACHQFRSFSDYASCSQGEELVYSEIPSVSRLSEDSSISGGDQCHPSPNLRRAPWLQWIMQGGRARKVPLFLVTLDSQNPEPRWSAHQSCCFSPYGLTELGRFDRPSTPC